MDRVHGSRSSRSGSPRAIGSVQALAVGLLLGRAAARRGLPVPVRPRPRLSVRVVSGPIETTQRSCHRWISVLWHSRSRQKACVPSFLATKYSSSQSAGCTAARSDALPGLAIGPGGSPVRVYVLYGLVLRRSGRVMSFDHRPVRSRVAYITVGSACSGIPFLRRLCKTHEIRGRSDGLPVSFSTMDASVTSCTCPRSIPGARSASICFHSSSCRRTIASRIACGRCRASKRPCRRA